MDYFKDIFEIVINAESINISSVKLNEIMDKAVNSNLFKKMIVKIFIKNKGIFI